MKDILTENETRGIFSNVVSLKSFSQKLLEDLQYKISNWTLESTLGDVFAKYVPFFKVRIFLEFSNWSRCILCIVILMRVRMRL
jgi:hypothetical protein